MKKNRRYYRPDPECMLCDGEGKVELGQRAVFRPGRMEFDVIDEYGLCECCEEEEPDVDPYDALLDRGSK